MSVATLEKTELSSEEFSTLSGFNIENKTEEEILNNLYNSSLKYYYATFNVQDFLEKLNNLNPGYSLNDLKIISVKDLYLAIY